MKWNAKWICPPQEFEGACPVFIRDFFIPGKIKKAEFSVTAMGVYEAELNGKRIGEFILAPGWTAYEKRLQVQTYDITELLSEKDSNHLTVTLGSGWYRGVLGWEDAVIEKNKAFPAGLTAQLTLTLEDDQTIILSTDESWRVSEGCVRSSELYDGEIYDAAFEASSDFPVHVFDGPTETLIPQQGEEIREQERLTTARIFTTPAGETVVDFGQNMTGYVEMSFTAHKGECAAFSCAEVLDRDGNFYRENYRGAKAQYKYLCREGAQTCKPRLTFYGFRYIRIESFPGGVHCAKPENFTAVVLHSKIKRTGYLKSSNSLLNKLFENVIWGQKGNFLDVPTDCPQRDERLGWTGDAQVFIRTACYNFDTEKFFMKWLADMDAEQHEDGLIGHVIPDVINSEDSSAAWGDAAVICPWMLYLAYGNPAVLSAQFNCMKKWIHYITVHTTTPNLWTGCRHYGDWLGLDAEPGSFKGASRDDFVASAFYAYSVSLVIKAGKVLGEDVTEYEELYQNIKAAFRSEYPKYYTQTECVLAAYFKLADDCQKAADQLAEMIISCGNHLATGFVGTPYLLHVLSDYGYSSLAYTLLLRKEYPSWLYPVTKGATTIWEHWDGIREDGSFWNVEMNSFNHYAYGAVADWVYGVAAGITPIEEYPGYEKVKIAPVPDVRLDWLEASLETRHGKISSRWEKEDSFWRYEIETPVEAVITIADKTHTVSKGHYIFYSPIA